VQYVGLAIGAVLVLLLTSGWRRWWRTDRIAPWEVGLLYGPRGFIKQLAPGVHTRFDPSGRQQLFAVPTVTRTLPGQVIDAISKDQFAFRLTLTPVVTVVDTRALIEQTAGSTASSGALTLETRFDRLQPTLSAAALRAVAARTLEDVLADPSAIAAEIAPLLGAVLPGTRLDELLVTGVTLPPEVRKMFTEVERARREGLASLERARSEQAALRALANAARNLADNPALAQLRMLQMMENAKGAKTFVIGGRADETVGTGA
jgi:regulator of protease activity HflC (stomatin/prohibitin superfamily)